MSWPKLLVLVRHAESEGNVLTAEQRTQYDMGSQKYALTERGRRQAQITGEYIRKLYPKGFDYRYESYYIRSKETMSYIYPGCRIYEDPRLAEAQRGIWHTMTHEEVMAKYPDEVVRKKREGLYHYRPPGGENWPDVELRIHSFLGTLNRDYGEQSVIIVGHGHWMLLFEKLIHHHSIEETVANYKEKSVNNASVTIYVPITINGKERLNVIGRNITPWLGLV